MIDIFSDFQRFCRSIGHPPEPDLMDFEAFQTRTQIGGAYNPLTIPL